jgi:hypothetical protein
MIKKILFIVLIVLFSLFLLLVFVLYNFPYDSAISRIDAYLRNAYSVDLSVSNVRYRFPFKLIFEDVRLTGDGIPISVSMRILTLRPGLFGENVVVTGQGLRLNGNVIEVKGASFTIDSKLRLMKLGREFSPEIIESLNIKIDNAKVERVHISGFEFTSFTISTALLSLKKRDDLLRIEQGLCRSDLFTSEISGFYGSRNVEIMVSLKLSDKFFKQYANLTGLVGSLTEDDTIRFSIKGTPQKLTFNIESKPGTL